MTRSSLFLCHRLPYPPNKGDKIRSYALLRHLARRGPVHLACFVDDADDLQYLDKVRELAGGPCYFERLGAAAKAWRSLTGLLTGKPLTTACFGSGRLQAWVNQSLHAQPMDDVVVFGSAMAPYLLKAPIAPARILFDMVDIDSDKWRQYAARSRGSVKWLYAREAEKLEALERLAADAFGHTLLASDFEADTFKSIAPASAGKISGLTNGVDLERFSPGNFNNPFGPDELPIVMTGRMDYRPNYEGALWFAREVFPQVLKFVPNARVHFVGSGPPAQLREAAGSGVEVTGAVADVRPYIQFARAVIAPLHIARGIQNKVLEAMAMAKPVVATHDATRSLGIQAGHHLWVEKDSRRFANAVVEALQGPDRENLARNGRDYVKVHHDWAGLMKDFEQHLDLLRGPRPDIDTGPVVPRPGAGRHLEFSASCKS